MELRPNYAELRIAKRRRVQNHIGTVHVIAICNGLEAAMGALAEASIPPGRRWIPKGMAVDYTAKATSDITCVAETDPEQWTGGEADVPVRVRAVRADGTVVVAGVIRLHVSDRPEAALSSLKTAPLADGVGAQPRRLARSASVSSVVQPCSCSHPVAPPKRSAMTWRMRAIVSRAGGPRAGGRAGCRRRPGGA